jgi:hypothetical protein
MEYKVPITNKQKQIVDYAFVSLEDFEHIKKYSWTLKASKNEKTGYELKYAQGSVNRKYIRMHHLILGKPENRKKVVDHKDGNGLNNRRENLHFASHEQNSQNRFVNKEGKTSTFIGVSKKIGKTWSARYSKNRLGIHENEEDAAKAYDTFVLVKLGPTAKTNGLVIYDDVKDIELDSLLLKQKEYMIYQIILCIIKRRKNFMSAYATIKLIIDLVNINY